MGKRKKKPHKPKSEDTNQKNYLLHMDLCGPMRVAGVNGNKYILVIVDDYSWITLVKCLRSKDEAPYFIIKFLKMIQEKVDISHETSVARSSHQNGVIERRNHTLIEASRTMLIYAKALLFLWAEAVATACYTQNRSIIRLRHGKTPYELLHDKIPDLSFFHVFGALCYLTNDSENLGKLQPKADICLEPALHEMTSTIISSGLVPNPPPSTPFVPELPSGYILRFRAGFSLDGQEIVKKYGMLSSDSVDTPLVEKSIPDEDLQGKPVDATLYRGMIGSLMYLTSSRPDLTYAVCLCFSMSLTAYANADHAGCQDTRRSTSRSAQFLGASGEWNRGVIFCSTEYQLAAIFTKPLPRERFNFLIEKLGIKSMSPDMLKWMSNGGVPDVPTYGSDDDQISLKSSDDEDDDDVDIQGDDDQDDDNANDEDDDVKSLEDDFLEFKQTNLFAEAVLSIPSIVDMYLTNKMNEAIKTTIQLQSDRIRDEAQAKNKDFINKLDENIKIIKEQVKVQVKELVSKILPRIEKLVNEQLKTEVLTRSSNKAKTSYAVAANLSELELKKILIDKMESYKSIHRSVQQMWVL
nr:hypothetical protein [Tanacetum cinerariifolium]